MADSAEAPPDGPRRKLSRPRKLAVILGSVTVGALLLAVLFFVPLVSNEFQLDASVVQDCQPFTSCAPWSVEYTVGRSGYMTFSAGWFTNVSWSAVTVNDGPSNVACIQNCSGLLYSSVESNSGYFAVSGYGPFHLSVFAMEGRAVAALFAGSTEITVI
jgi:hypothetical protein